MECVKISPVWLLGSFVQECGAAGRGGDEGMEVGGGNIPVWDGPLSNS